MTAAGKAIARCKVVICIEVIPGEVWAEDCSIAHVREQGAKEAEDIVRNMIAKRLGGGSVKLIRIDAVNVVTFDRATAEPANG